MVDAVPADHVVLVSGWAEPHCENELPFESYLEKSHHLVALSTVRDVSSASVTMIAHFRLWIDSTLNDVVDLPSARAGAFISLHLL